MPFQNYEFFDSLTSMTHNWKFLDTSRSAGALKIWLHLDLGVWLRGKSEWQNLSFQAQEKNDKSGLFFITGQLLIGWWREFSLSNRPKGAENTPGSLFPRHPTYLSNISKLNLFKKNFVKNVKHVVLNMFSNRWKAC